MLEELADRIASRKHEAGVFLDFDGTLAEIAATPEGASALPGVSAVLNELTGSYRTVVIVSGRRARDVEGLVGSGVRIFGLHGLEEIGQDLPVGDAILRVLPQIEDLAAAVGARVERKGPQVAVHYRDAPDPERVRASLVQALEPIAAESDLRLSMGRRIIEIAERDAPAKGDVLTRVANEDALRAVLYAGDDVGDLDAFLALDRLARQGIAGVKIAVVSPEAPMELLEAADATVDGPEGLLEFLRLLLR